MTNPKMMNSGRPRIKDDDYKTLDPRCVLSLLEYFGKDFKDKILVDCCAPTGSGIANLMVFAGMNVKCIGDAFQSPNCDWIITNPPYKRPLVDAIVINRINHLKQGNIRQGVAMLLRTNFDHAKTRLPYFNSGHYYGQIKMMYRPRWFEKRDGDKTPFHNFVWHIWTASTMHDNPIVMYSTGE